MKWDDDMIQMKTLYELALSMESNPDVTPIYYAGKCDVKTLVTKFNIKAIVIIE